MDFYSPRLVCNAAHTFSAVSGKSVTRTPTARSPRPAVYRSPGLLPSPSALGPGRLGTGARCALLTADRRRTAHPPRHVHKILGSHTVCASALQACPTSTGAHL